MLNYLIDMIYATSLIIFGIIGLGAWVLGVAYAVFIVEFILNIAMWFLFGKQIKLGRI